MSSAGPRRLRILAKLAEGDRGLDSTRLCEVCTDVIGVSGSGIMLIDGDVMQGSVCNSNAVSAQVDQLHFALGEGPCVDAHDHDRPVLEPNLAAPAAVRWPAFSDAALALGVRAIFGFPLHVGAARFGALDLYNDTPGRLTDDQFADTLVMADVAAHAVLLMQAEAPPGQLAAELEAGGSFQFVVHQASGMVSAQLSVSVGEAMTRLRAYAFGDGRPLAEVARDVVERRLRLDR
ncbi:MAG: hypothetical protein JWN46_2291 [Acidimicrobiales bacterium]|nr:hypothetical protein [Acidimicrobiales bacterium]